MCASATPSHLPCPQPTLRNPGRCATPHHRLPHAMAVPPIALRLCLPAALCSPTPRDTAPTGGRQHTPPPHIRSAQQPAACLLIQPHSTGPCFLVTFPPPHPPVQFPPPARHRHRSLHTAYPHLYTPRPPATLLYGSDGIHSTTIRPYPHFARSLRSPRYLLDRLPIPHARLPRLYRRRIAILVTTTQFTVRTLRTMVLCWCIQLPSDGSAHIPHACLPTPSLFCSGCLPFATSLTFQPVLPSASDSPRLPAAAHSVRTQFRRIRYSAPVCHSRVRRTVVPPCPLPSMPPRCGARFPLYLPAVRCGGVSLCHLP